MSKLPIEERALAFALAHPPSNQSTAPVPEAAPKASSPRPAVRRCCNAWQRAFDAYMAEHKSRSSAHIFATGPASVAYCNAMPMLSGSDGIRDFIACVAHGVLIGAIPEKRAGHLLYAAQVALASLQREAKPPVSRPRTPPPLPSA
jgi:hypothetical protein